MTVTARLGRPQKYDWDELADGTERTLERGQDFDCTAESFVVLARRTARIRHMKIEVSRISDDLVRFKFYAAQEVEG
jgi:hypothetical protein